MHERHQLPWVALIVFTLAGAAAPAHAVLDAPVIRTGVSGHGKQAVIITAGPSGLPDGFTIRWMDESLFARYGGQWPATPDPAEGRASFTGTATLNEFYGNSFRLQAGQTAVVEVGDLFQETGVAGTVDELVTGTRYRFVAFANDATGNAASVLSATAGDATTPDSDCLHTQGYWKNHKESWPVSSLTLGSVTYTQPQLCDILDHSVRGNGLVSLAHQLIAAKLNLAQPKVSAATMVTIVAALDVFIGGLVVPPVGSGYLAPAQVSGYTQTLDNFNNGIGEPGQCAAVASQTRSWGAIKALYR